MLKTTTSRLITSLSMATLLFACSTKDSDKKKDLKSATPQQAEIQHIKNSATNYKSFESKINTQEFKVFLAKSDKKIPVKTQSKIANAIMGDQNQKVNFNNAKNIESLPQLNQLLADLSKTCDEIVKNDDEAFAYSCKFENTPFRLSGAANDDMAAWYLSTHVKEDETDASINLALILDLKKESIETILNLEVKQPEAAVSGYLKLSISLNPIFDAIVEGKANWIDHDNSGNIAVTGKINAQKITVTATNTEKSGQTSQKTLDIDLD